MPGSAGGSTSSPPPSARRGPGSPSPWPCAPGLSPSHERSPSRRPAPFHTVRLAWAAWLLAVLATSIGHGIGQPGSSDPPETCRDGSVQVSASGQGQTGFAGAPLGSPLRLDFSCTGSRSNQSMAAAVREVRWTVTSGGGTANGSAEHVTPASNPDGARYAQAELHWSLGATVIGTQTLSVFDARVLNSVGAGVQLRGAPGSWSLQQCEVSGSGGHGIVVESNAGPITGCTIAGNAGSGVHSLQPGSFSVDARGNWWGDAAGPFGGAGDGVSPGVDYTGPLGAPSALGY